MITMLKLFCQRVLQYTPPASITLLYLLLGGGLIAYKHDLIAFFPRNTLLSVSTNSFVEFSILLISAAIFHIFLINLKNMVASQSENNTQFLKNKLVYLCWIFVILLVIPLANLGIYHQQKPKVEAETYANLAAITAIKVQRINNWLQDRVADGNMVSANEVLATEIDKTLRQRDVSANRSIATYFDTMLNTYHFERIALYSATGQLYLQTNTPELPSITQPPLEKTLLTKVIQRLKAQHGDFYIDAQQKMNLQVLAPIFKPQNLNTIRNKTNTSTALINSSRREIIAYVLIQTGIANTELPSLQSWPSAYNTANVALVRHQGNNITIVRGKAEDAGAVRVEYQTNHLKTLYKASGGRHKGVNAVGVDAYGFSTAIPNSDWRYFAETAQHEVLANLNNLLFWTSVCALITAFIIALVLFLLWKQQKSAYKLALSIKDIELNKLLNKFHSMPFIGFGTINAKTNRWTNVNPRLCEILGYSEDEFQQHLATDFNHPDENNTDAVFYNSLQSGELSYVRRDKRFIDKAGNVVYTQIEVNAIKNDAGGMASYVVAVENITARVLIEQALTTSEERLDLVVKGSNDGWWDLDLATNTAHHSDRWWTMLGYPQNMDVIDAQYWQTLTHPDDLAPMLTYLREVIAGNETHYEVELRLRHFDGHYLNVLTRGFIARDASGKAIRIAGTNTDITAFKKADQEIIRLNRLLSMITNTNQLITRKPGAPVLFNEVCKIAVNDGGFCFAWVGLLSEEQTALKCVTHAGSATDFIALLDRNISTISSNIPAITCITQSQYVICNHIGQSNYDADWIKRAQACGFQSMVALPIARFGKIMGNFSLFSLEELAFGDKEIALLDELAADISYALEIEDNENLRKQTAKALTESEALFHNLASNSPVGIFRTDEHGKLTYYNDIWRNITVPSIEEIMAGIVFPATIHHEDYPFIIKTFKESLLDKVSFNLEFRMMHADAKVLWVKCQAQPSLTEKGQFNGFVGTLTDVTDFKNIQQSLFMAGIVIENTREAILVTDSDVNVVMVNKAFTDIEGYTAKEMLGKNPNILHSGRHSKDYFVAMFDSLNDTGAFQSEIWNRNKQGEIHPGILSITVVRNAKAQITHYVSVFTDITNLKQTEERLAFLANHDPLTGLPNRMMLAAHISHAIEGAKRHDKKIALLLLDLDRFKNVNDSYGHMAGDDLLNQLANRLRSTLRANDMIARLGGDEFVILLEDIEHPEFAAKVANNIIEAINAPWVLSKHNAQVTIGTSVGISLYPEHGDNAQDLLKHADAAMYQAKNSGRGVVKYYSEQLTKLARRRLKLETRLREAIELDELELHYQPKIDVFSGNITGVEALVRWIDPKVGMIMPAEFISIAEETGLIKKLGAWVLNEACRQGKVWLDHGIDINIAVNISAIQLYDEDITQLIRNALAKSGFPAHHLQLELTESILMRREKESITKLYQIKELGIQLAVDDFGAGYSSLSYLRRFPLDVLKIDRSFIADLDDDKDDRAITATIIGIGRTLNLTVVAEGVETQSQLNFLASHGCHQYQGFFASPALSASLLESFIRDYQGNNVF